LNAHPTYFATIDIQIGLEPYEVAEIPVRESVDVFLFGFLDEGANAIKGGCHLFLGGCHLVCELHEAALGSGLAANNTCRYSPRLPTTIAS